MPRVVIDRAQGVYMVSWHLIDPILVTGASLWWALYSAILSLNRKERFYDDH